MGLTAGGQLPAGVCVFGHGRVSPDRVGTDGVDQKRVTNENNMLDINAVE